MFHLHAAHLIASTTNQPTTFANQSTNTNQPPIMVNQNIEYNFSYKGPAVAGGPPPAPPSFGDMAALPQSFVGGGTATIRPGSDLTVVLGGMASRKIAKITA